MVEEDLVSVDIVDMIRIEMANCNRSFRFTFSCGSETKLISVEQTYFYRTNNVLSRESPSIQVDAINPRLMASTCVYTIKNGMVTGASLFCRNFFWKIFEIFCRIESWEEQFFVRSKKSSDKIVPLKKSSDKINVPHGDHCDHFTTI